VLGAPAVPLPHVVRHVRRSRQPPPRALDRRGASLIRQSGGRVYVRRLSRKRRVSHGPPRPSLLRTISG
jgi:hypothetical protein